MFKLNVLVVVLVFGVGGLVEAKVKGPRSFQIITGDIPDEVMGSVVGSVGVSASVSVASNETNANGVPVVHRNHLELLLANYVPIYGTEIGSRGFRDLWAYPFGTAYSPQAFNDYDFWVYNPVTDSNDLPSTKFYFTTTAEVDENILFMSSFDNARFGLQYYHFLYGKASGPQSFDGTPIANIYGVEDLNPDDIIGYVNWGTGSLIFGGDGDVVIIADDLIIGGVRGGVSLINDLGTYTFGNLPNFTIPDMVYRPIVCNSPGDFNGDCLVNFVDFTILSSGWLTTYDFNDLTDLSNGWLTSVE